MGRFPFDARREVVEFTMQTFRFRLGGPWLGFLWAILIYGVPPALAVAGGPTDAIKQTSDQVLHILADDNLREPDRVADRRQRLLDAVAQRFSYEEMSRRALGEHWPKLTVDERREFVEVFQLLLARSYISKIERYASEPVHYLGERVANGYAEVRAKLASTKNDFLLDFRLVERAGEWLVFDVIVDGISLIGSYRMQLARVLQHHAYSDLVTRLREQAGLPLEARAR